MSANIISGAPQWQSIETAPTDGTKLLLLSPFAGICVGWFDSDTFAKKPKPFWSLISNWRSTTDARAKPPTHWMPLPELPK